MDDGFQRTVVPLTGTDHREPESARVPGPSAPTAGQPSRTRRPSSSYATNCTSSTTSPPRSGSFKFDPHIQQETHNSLRGFTNYFRFAVAKQDFGSLEWYALQRVRRWMQRVHGGMSWRDLARRFVRNGTFVVDGVVLFLPGSVPVERYRYRGAQIFNLWQRPRASPAP